MSGVPFLKECSSPIPPSRPAERCETAAVGRLLVEKCFANPVQRLDWALSFGGGIEVIEPEALRREIRKQAQKMLEQNKETGQ